MGFRRADAEFYYAQRNLPLPRAWWARRFAIRSLRVAALFRHTARSTGLLHVILREYLMTVYSCDVSSGAKINGPLYIPHPIGIVIGAGATIGRRVQIFHSVTLGRDGLSRYPTIEDDTKLFAGCSVIGGVSVGAGALVSAGAVVTGDVPSRT